MKIALCMWGEPRDVDKSYPGIKNNLIDPNGITDVFCHFWHDQRNVGDMYNKTRTNGETGEYRAPNLFVREETPSLVYRLYNPIACEFEHYKEWPTDEFMTEEYKCKHMIPVTQSMFYSIAKVFQFVKDRDYDFIVSMRPDVLLKERIEISKFKKHTLYSNNEVGHAGGVNDWLAIGCYETMAAHSNIHQEKRSLWQTEKKMVPEILIGEQMRRCKIPNTPSIQSFGLLR